MFLAVDVPSLDHFSYVGQRLSDDLTALVVPPVANGVAYSRRELRCPQQEYWISRTSGAVGALAFQKTHQARVRGAATAPCLQTGCYGAGSVKGRERVQDQRSTGAEATSLNARSFVPSGSTERGARPRSPMRVTLGDGLSVGGAGRSPGATRAPLTRGSGWTLTAYATVSLAGPPDPGPHVKECDTG